MLAKQAKQAPHCLPQNLSFSSLQIPISISESNTLSHSLSFSLSIHIQMDSIEESSSSTSSSTFAPSPSRSGAKILVGVPLDARASCELLSWAVGVAARPDDTVIALHVLVGKEESRSSHDMNRFRRAKAFVISMLGEFAEACQTKQVKLEAKVRSSSSIGRGLIHEAALLDASNLLIGGPRKPSQRSFFEIMKHCFKHAPEGCSIIAIGKQSLPRDDTELEPMMCEGTNSSSSRWANNDSLLVKGLPPLQRLFGSKVKRDKRLSVTEIIYEKSSPVAVLDGPEEGEREECFSPVSKEISGRHSRSKIWRRLSIVKLLSPFFRPPSEDVGEIDECASNFEGQKPSWRCFSYEEISKATNDFHQDNIVGKGGYAEVFRGQLYNGQSVAVKRLATGNKDENKEREFLTELGIVGHVCHPNTAFLIGCCIENGLHLIFDFSPNGTLASALHGKNSKFLDWPTRFRIAVGVAQGLHYLHKCCRRRIIHRDIKASNVLLGPDFEPQISDFGLAKWLPRQWTHHYVNPIEGTFGYLAPEYFMHGIVDEKTDVFAFGVLLLEIISGRRPIDSSRQSLFLWARPLIDSGNLVALADPKLRGKYDKLQLQRLVLTASYCVRQSSIWRPTMSEVMDLLTEVHESEATESWRTPELQCDDELNDYTII